MFLELPKSRMDYFSCESRVLITPLDVCWLATLLVLA